MKRAGSISLIGLALTSSVWVAAPPAWAVRVGTGAIVSDVAGTLDNFTACTLITFSSTPYDVFGTSVNLGTSVQQIFCIGQTIAGVQQLGHCTSSVAGALNFDLLIDALCEPPTCLGHISFVSNAVSNVVGTVPASVGPASYTFDGAGDFESFEPSTTIPGCPIVGGVAHFSGEFGMNAFQPVATPTGSGVTIESTTSFFNSISGQSVDLQIDVGFAAVGAPGETIITATSNSSAALSSNFAASVDGYQAAFLDIQTTAMIAPPITVCSTYPDADHNGILDGTSVPETALRILHGEGDPVTFVDRTVSQNVTTNEICAEVDHLSPFVTVVNLCGNGTINGGETCDDGNPDGNDGCSAACLIESGWQCTTPGSACTFVCGNSTVNGSESCDDGDAIGGDGCSASCQVEPGYQCTTPGMPCTFVCGNGTVDGSEECDDGDTDPNDGCDAQCLVEECYSCVGAAPSVCTAQNGTSCDDGDLCTTADTCQTGSCVGTATTCNPLGQCFDAGTCNPLTGTCSNPPKSPGSGCDDGDGCPADSCQAGECQAVSCPAVDVVTLPLKPLNVTIRPTATAVTKSVSIVVRNADSVDRTISLALDAADCPAGIAGDPDFVPDTPAADASIVVPAGKTRKAKIALTLLPAAFDSFNYKAPTRCTLAIAASAVVAGGSNDPNPANNVALVEINVVDKHDLEHSTGGDHETTVKSMPPTKMNIPLNKPSVSKTLNALVGNADYRPTAELPGDVIEVEATTTCPGLNLGAPVCNTTTLEDFVTVKGGKTATCKITATAFTGPIDTTNQLSAQRCVVTLSAHGPSDPEMPPLDASNNTTELIIDVLDKNDF